MKIGKYVPKSFFFIQLASIPFFNIEFICHLVLLRLEMIFMDMMMDISKSLKIHKFFAVLCLLLSWLTVSPPLLKAEDETVHTRSPSFHFKAGQEAFRKGLHEDALQDFLDAQAAGLSKPSLYYNIGVCYYKLGRYPEAEQAFRKTAEYPDMVSLAYYNLGLISLQQQQSDAAINRFKRARFEAKNQKLRLMADAALEKLKKEEQKITWMQYASFGFGYDDNVALLADTENVRASGSDDFFAEILGHISGYLSENPSERGTQFHANVYLLHYLELDEYDVSSFFVSLLHKETINTLQMEARGEYAYTLLDESRFEQVPSLSFQLKYPLQSAKSVVRFRYRLSYLDILDDDYEYLAGYRHQFLGESFWKWSAYSALLGYVLETNDRDDPDFSPTRHTIKALFSVRPAPLVRVSLGVNYRDSKYDITNDNDRHEERMRGELRCTLFMKNDWELNGEYQYTDNDSNYEKYTYVRNMIVLSLSRSF
ncbi:MAG: tetratricopeptide repeat protein [Desulfobulbaceae bacterium]|nr:tetratricopeptide repeat protein [Desulfobulbaceae bacterium]